MADDQLIAKHEGTELDASRAERAANLFDIRRIIGGLFAIYGVILTIMGIGASDGEIAKAAGINLNLWVGLAMLVVAALFLVWAFARPVGREVARSQPAGPGAGGDGEGAREEVGARAQEGQH